MRRSKGCQILSAVLALVVLVMLLPLQVSAASANRFVLVAEAGGRLVIAPEYVTYEPGQTIGQALAACDHSLEGLEEGSVHTIDGVTGSYSRSDQNGEYALDQAASSVTHYRFSENASSSQPSEALQELMTEMADYLQEPEDVQMAAKTAYDEACRRFVGAADAEAEELCAALQDAVEAYEISQSTTGTVAFSDGEKGYTDENYTGVEIVLENAYGKTYTDDGDGTMTVPRGVYTFTVSCSQNHIQGSVTVGTAAQTVSAAMPEVDWLKKDAFCLSESYGDEFEGGIFAMEPWDGRTVHVLVPDTFSGTVYTYAEYDTELLTAVPGLSAIYTDQTGAQRQKSDLAFESRKVGPDRVLAVGSEGNRAIYRVTAVMGDYTVSQDYTVEFQRIPSLSAIFLQDQSGIDLAATEQFEAGKTAYTYKVLDTVTAVTVFAAPQESDYTVRINGQNGANGVSVPMNEDGSDTVIEVVVSGGSYTTTYTLNVQPGKGQQVTLTTNASDVTIEVTNSNGLVLPFTKYKGADSYNRYVYTLVPGETYYYVASYNTYYHATDDFTLEDAHDSIIEVEVQAEDWLRDLSLGIGNQAGKKDTLQLDTVFSSETHRYSLEMEDTETNVFVWVDCDKSLSVSALYTQLHASSLYHGVEKNIALISGTAQGVQMQRLLIQENPVGNTMTIRLSREDNGVTYYQDYVVDVTRNLSLAGLSASCGDSTVLLTAPDGTAGYSPVVREYTLSVPMAADKLELAVESYVRRLAGSSWNTCYGDETTGYRAWVNGTDVTAQKKIAVELDGTVNNQTVELRVTNEKVPGLESIYTLTIQKAAPTVVELNITPEDAMICVHERASANRIWPENGTLLLSEGFTYDYTLTRNGYVGVSGVMEVTRDADNHLVLLHNEETITVQATEDGTESRVELRFVLDQAEENQSINTDITAEWLDFRGNAQNNGVTTAKIPVSAASGTLQWAIKLGEGIDADAVGSPILVDGALITYAGSTLYRVDPVSGEILATGEMDHKSSFSITPPTYDQGMLFVALSNGTVQAFNAETLESLWIYNDPLGGQPNSPIAVCDGYLYTGFWNQEDQKANFVCLSVTDEDPAQAKESKPATWYHTQVGGYYWAGAYACKDYVLVGTDDGTKGCTSPTGSLQLFDAKTGKLLDRWEGLNGDVRATVCHDTVTDAFYVTSKGGTFYSVSVVETETGWKLANKWLVELSNGMDAGVPMSTSTPVVYNGRAYVGVSGVGQFSAMSGHNITVIDLTKKSIAYTVPTKGYPQTSGLLTTAYEEDSGYVYVCFVDNYTPGKLRLIRDKAGQKTANYVTMEEGYELAYDLFAPSGSHAQYAICSPIVDSYGTMYLKNDSGHLMAFGNQVTSIAVTQQPEKTVYAAGERFDPTGMVVTATYANGKTRDVTAYVTWNEGALTASDSTVTVVFPHVLYHNEETGSAMDAGVVTTKPTAIIAVTVTGEVTTKYGDANRDGSVTIEDARLVLQSEAQAEVVLDETVADVSGDGKLDSNDAVLILQYIKGTVTVFPVETEE